MLPFACLWTGNTWVPAARLNQNGFVDDDDGDGDVNDDCDNDDHGDDCDNDDHCDD